MGAIKNFVSLQDEYECLYMLADYHAITSRYKKEEIKNHIFETASAFLSSGVNDKKI